MLATLNPSGYAFIAGLVFFYSFALYRAVGRYAHHDRSKVVAYFGAVGITMGFFAGGTAILAGALVLADALILPLNGIWTEVLIGGVSAAVIGVFGRWGWRVAKMWMSRPSQI